MAQSLNGVRVLDLMHYISCLYCSGLFTQIGAEAIKIKKPGDSNLARSIPPFFLRRSPPGEKHLIPVPKYR